MSNLYNINQEYVELMQELLNNEGELTPELEEKLAINEDELQQKVEAYSFVIANLQGLADSVDTEIKRLQALKKQRQNAVDRLKERVSNAMQLHGIEEILCSIARFSFRKSTVVDITGDVPAEYCNKTVTLKPDKKLIKQKLQEGEAIPNCSLIEKQNLQIK